jgi:amidase
MKGSDMSTFVTRMNTSGDGIRLAVKDIIDVAGVPTTAGCRALATSAAPATSDAACLAGAHSAGARIVGKTNLHELAMLPFGTNPWFGNPTNPLDPRLIPGGSSSGSAVAVATGEADVALGSDTGGSVRIPAACCGITGLKTTHGRIPLQGVWPLAPSFDTVGPMAPSVAGVVAGMQLLEPGFAPSPVPARTIGRLRSAGRPEIEAAVDAALRETELEVVDVEWSDFETGTNAWTTIYFAELWEADHELAERDPQGVGEDVAATIAMADMFRPAADEARQQLEEWRTSLFSLFDRVELLALPTLPVFPPRLDDLNPDTMVPTAIEITRHTALFNAAGTPCTAQPVPTRGSSVPASLQLVGPLRSEELLLATCGVVESAAG